MARDLKYRAVDTDFASLERELRGAETAVGVSDTDGIPDSYADLADEYDEYSEDDDYDERSSS